MALTELSLETMADSAGNTLRDAMNSALQHIAKDVISRDGIRKPREVKIHVRITPSLDPQTGQNMPQIEWVVDHKVPGTAGSPIIGMVRDGGLVVSNMTDDARQATLDETLPADNISGFRVHGS